MRHSPPTNHMIIDRQRLDELIRHPFAPPGPAELKREGNVFFIGGGLDPRETLETVFDSHCQAPAELMTITFGSPESFHAGEEHVRLLKKNFHIHLLGQIDYPAPGYLLERAYAAGIDIIDIPLHTFDPGLSREPGLHREERLAALKTAKGIFPAWGVASTINVGEEASSSTVSAIDTLLSSGVVPLPQITTRAGNYPRTEMEEVFDHLAGELKRRKVAMKPFLPLLALTTPFTAGKPAGVLKGFIDLLQDRRLLAASDLRRSLRIRQVEESYGSSGL